MKNKKLLIIGGIVIAILVVGGVFLATRSKDDKSQQSAQTNTEASGAGTESTSLNSLLSSGQNKKCTYSYKDESGNTSNGTVYITSGKMRGYFTATTANGEVKSNILILDSGQYGWQEGSATGYKFNINTDNAQQQNQSQQSVDQNKNYDFSCTSWSVDDSQFAMPAGVTFTDLSAQAQQVQQGASQICAGLTDATARAACEANTQQ